MNIDRILDVLNRHKVAYILIGGVNYLLRHKPELTFDIDIWIEDNPANRQRCQRALEELDAEWGPTDDQWRPVRQHPEDWLGTQMVYCLTSPYGAIDIFRCVEGLGAWQDCRTSADEGCTAGGIAYVGLSDEDMLRCQYAWRKDCGNSNASKRSSAKSERPSRMTNHSLKEAEEARRERHWDPAVRWRVLQETIAWAEAQATVRRNSKAARLAEQRKKLARLASRDTVPTEARCADSY